VSQQEFMLVVSAHAADFVWRAGGAVALAASRGDRVKVLCVTYGERGDLAKRRGTQLKRNAGPNLGLPQSTVGEACMRVFPQVTDRLS
jgi:LmbE family N-acetylglucosaminyl deacetylase